MTNLPPPDTPAVFWIDAAGQQQGPEPLSTVIERVVAEQIPPSTPVWWQGAVNWAPFSANEQLVSAVEARRTPPPPVAAAPTQSPFAPAGFDEPSPQPSGLLFQTPATLEVPFAPTNGAPVSPVGESAPVSYEPAPASYEASPTYEVSPIYEAPVAYEAPVTYDPAPAAYDASPAYEAPVAYESAPADAGGFAATTAVPVVEVPDAYAHGIDAPAAPVILPEPEPAPVVLPEAKPAAPSLALGDPDQLRSTFADLTARGAAYAEEESRAAGLDEQFAVMVAHALTELGYGIDERQSSGEYHSFRLTAPDGAVASVAVERLGTASSVAAAVERPVMCFVDRGGRASARLFVGDYVANGGQDVDLLRRHLASIVDAAVA